MRELSIINDGALLVRGSRIEKTGTRSEIESLVTSDCEVIDAGRRIVLPGFVDAHAHPVFAGTRADEFEERAAGMTYQEIAARGGGIKSTVRATRAATQDDLIESGKRYAAWFLRCGTTTVEAKSGYGLTAGRRAEDPACYQATRSGIATALCAHLSGRPRHSRRV